MITLTKTPRPTLESIPARKPTTVTGGLNAMMADAKACNRRASWTMHESEKEPIAKRTKMAFWALTDTPQTARQMTVKPGMPKSISSSLGAIRKIEAATLIPTEGNKTSLWVRGPEWERLSRLEEWQL